MFRIVNGSKEVVVVDLVDVTGAITNLSTLSPKFTVRQASDNTDVVTLATATASNMRISCLIDTVAVEYEPGLHYLYVSFTSGTEVPLIFAGDFHVV